MKPYICEFLGTMLLIIIGNGSVCNARLEKSGMKGAGPLFIAFSWGLAVMLPVIIFATASLAVFNPAVAIVYGICGTLPWIVIPGYIIAEFLGAMLGQLIAWIIFKDHFDATTDPATKFGCFATSPSIRNIPRNLFCEIVGTFILVFTAKGITQVIGLVPGMNALYMFAIVSAIGMSLGGVTGYAINPARDLGPRIMYAILPIKDKGSCHWDYAWVPVVGPIIGALVAIGVYTLVFGA